MIVETPLTGFDDALKRPAGWRVLVETTELSQFVCEGISLARLSAKGSNKLDGENKRSLEVALTLSSARNEDKDVDLVVELVREGQVLASTRLSPVEVEERSRASRQVRWKVRSEDIAAKPAGMIRVTVIIPGGDNLAAPGTVTAAPQSAVAPEPTTTAPTTEASAAVATPGSESAGRTNAASPPSPVDAATCRTLITEGDVDKTYYVTLKEISVSKKFYGSVEEMYGPLAEKARKIGADGVINVHTWHAVSGFAWAAPHAGGMAVRWTEAGRKALHGFPGRCY